ncbi:alkaline phosphatase [Cohnella xylanilytica]|uniref:DedA family protein n=1 Tax=Cohnella xylanilytica TaxID=557555 RepID=A0A841U2R9_9BACL|nr:DedA family protein [Cohnella xylanilytica]MBB6694836.1 DedA family protein [Cohnella xylanilytica]GIO11248.1 alkaline phosphatase [Cohnella xylanilytica]
MDTIHEWLNQLLAWVESLGYFGIIIGLAIEVIPSEIVLGYGGYLVSKGDINYWVAVLCGTIGALLQQWILYAIGRYGGRPVVDKFGKYLHLKPKHIDLAEKWFEKYGPIIVFTGRFVPVMRQVVSIPAGMARMNLTKFSILTLIASIPWSLLFVGLGWTLGDQWENIDEKAAPYVQPVILIALALLVVYFVYQYARKRSKNK